MKKKIYIAGKMSGLKFNNFLTFFRKEKELRKKGWKTINPARLNCEYARHNNITTKDLSYTDCIKMDIREILSCDAIYMMKGWKTSNGANLEIHIAATLGLKIIYE